MADGALRRLVNTFFNGSPASAATALLGLASQLDPDEQAALWCPGHRRRRGAGHVIALLVSLALKSGLVAAAGLLLAELFAKRPAAERADLLRATVGLMLALPSKSWPGPTWPSRNSARGRIRARPRRPGQRGLGR